MTRHQHGSHGEETQARGAVRVVLALSRLAVVVTLPGACVSTASQSRRLLRITETAKIADTIVGIVESA